MEDAGPILKDVKYFSFWLIVIFGGVGTLAYLGLKILHALVSLLHIVVEIRDLLR